MTKTRSYWHLSNLPRQPTEYDIVASRLLYYPERGFEVNVPFASWHERFAKASGLAVSDWERFHDPRETTYTKYTALQKTKETFVDELFKSAVETNYDHRLDRQWVDILAQTIAPLRYPFHGLQMISGYIGQLAPSGRLVMTCAYQAADEMRRIQRFAYRMRQLQETWPEFGKDSRSQWETAAAWQPLRQVIEQLLTTYDWGESFTALNLCLKPALDELLMVCFADRARAAGDDLLAQLLFSLNEDCRWHRAWATAVVTLALADNADNRSRFCAWIDKWDTRVTAALRALAVFFEGVPAPQAFAAIDDRVQTSIRSERQVMGLIEKEG